MKIFQKKSFNSIKHFGNYRVESPRKSLKNNELVCLREAKKVLMVFELSAEKDSNS